jgi:hypothetical protein
MGGTGATGVLGVGETDPPFSAPGGFAAATGLTAAGSGALDVTGGAAEGAGNSETLCPVFAAPDVPGDDGNPGAAGFCCGVTGGCDGF